jgi:hypothetical protein
VCCRRRGLPASQSQAEKLSFLSAGAISYGKRLRKRSWQHTSMARLRREPMAKSQSDKKRVSASLRVWELVRFGRLTGFASRDPHQLIPPSGAAILIQCYSGPVLPPALTDLTEFSGHCGCRVVQIIYYPQHFVHLMFNSSLFLRKGLGGS